MKVSAYLKPSRRVLSLASIFLLGAGAIALPSQPADASFSLFAPKEKQAREKQAREKQARGSVPGRRRGGARRGSCPEAQTELTALISATEVETETLPKTYVGGVTTAEYPTFWFNVPYALTPELTAEFVLQNDQGQDVYRTTSASLPAIEQTPGVMGISMSDAVAPLEIGKAYQWYFKLDCGTEAPLYVQGGIERVAIAPSLATQLANATPLEQAALYQENEIWYDAVNVLAQLRFTQPNDPAVETAWAELLQSLGL